MHCRPSSSSASWQSVTGKTWTAFLARTGGDFGPLAPILADAPYRPAATFDGHAAVAAARRWIRRQHA